MSQNSTGKSKPFTKIEVGTEYIAVEGNNFIGITSTQLNLCYMV